ncbi:MAG: Panacea domain-containing protein [Acidobacteriota bacterium]
MNARYRKEKAFNAIIYFLEHTSMCHKKKTYKLLWLLDSEHFQIIGRSITGYQYFAWKMGPVPTELHEAIESRDDAEFEEFFDVDRREDGKYVTITLVPKEGKSFDEKYFSRKEMELLEDLSRRYDMATGQEMEDLTHRPGTPWYQVWEIEHRKQEAIPYEYALSGLASEDKDIITNIAHEREAFLANY